MDITGRNANTRHIETGLAPALPAKTTIINSRCLKKKRHPHEKPGKVGMICHVRDDCWGSKGSWRLFSHGRRQTEMWNSSYLTCPTCSAQSGASLSRNWPCSFQTLSERSSGGKKGEKDLIQSSREDARKDKCVFTQPQASEESINGG